MHLVLSINKTDRGVTQRLKKYAGLRASILVENMHESARNFDYEMIAVVASDIIESPESALIEPDKSV